MKQIKMLVQQFRENDDLIENFKKSSDDDLYFEFNNTKYKKTSSQKLYALFYFNYFFGIISGVVFGFGRWYCTALFCLIVLILLPSLLMRLNLEKNKL